MSDVKTKYVYFMKLFILGISYLPFIFGIVQRVQEKSINETSCQKDC